MRTLERDVRDMSDRFSSDLRKLGERTARDSKALGERAARLEGLLEGSRDAITDRRPEAGGRRRTRPPRGPVRIPQGHRPDSPAGRPGSAGLPSRNGIGSRIRANRDVRHPFMLLPGTARPSPADAGQLEIAPAGNGGACWQRRRIADRRARP